MIHLGTSFPVILSLFVILYDKCTWLLVQDFWWDCSFRNAWVPVINRLLSGAHCLLLSSRNLMDRDAQDSFKLPCCMKQPGIVIENLTHYTSFPVKYINVLHNFDILVITQKKKKLGQIIQEEKLSSILNKSDCFRSNQLINI